MITIDFDQSKHDMMYIEAYFLPYLNHPVWDSYITLEKRQKISSSIKKPTKNCFLKSEKDHTFIISNDMTHAITIQYIKNILQLTFFRRSNNDDVDDNLLFEYDIKYWHVLEQIYQTSAVSNLKDMLLSKQGLIRLATNQTLIM